MLNRETKFGLTFGQLLALLGLVGGIITTYIDLNIKVATIDERNKFMEQRMDKIENSTEMVRQENRQDHMKMEAKMDYLIEKIQSK
jgi:proteasome assembly chaperone (PAC2) family protein